MTAAADATDWIAVDWGTSNLRVWMLDASGAVLARAESDRGMATLQRDGFEPALMALIEPHLAQSRVTPVLCCGMVGARQGWAEAGYLPVPCPPPGAAEATTVAARDPRIAVSILPGLRQTAPADVMRGEETQIAGFLRQAPRFDGVLCLPGTHTKWVRISDGAVQEFRSFMTGEIFALLSRQSVLRHTTDTDGWDDAAFAAGVADAISDPQSFAAQLFGLRAGALVADLAPEAAKARLSGLLIGSELAAARRYWSGRRVGIVGAGPLAGLYRTALGSQQFETDLHDVETLTLGGLAAARHSQKDARP